MASWKKVIVSGSDAVLNQLTVGTSQVVTSTNELTTTKLTGSFTGSFIGDGTGITGITATGLNIPGTVNVITNQPFVVSGSAALQKITLSDVLDQITGSGDNGLTKSGSLTLAVNTSSVHFQSGVSKEVFDSANFVDGSEIDFTVTAGTSVTAALKNNSIATGKLTTSGSTFGSTVVNLGDTVTSFTGFSSLTSVSITGSSITASGAIYGDSITANSAVINNALDVTQIEVGNPSGTATAGQIVTAQGITIENGGLTVQNNGINVLANGITVTGDSTFNDNLTVQGNFTVNGVVTTITSSNLLIADKFALFASGSDASTDGGIIIQQGASTGYALGVDASADRWSLQNNLGPTSTSITPDSYMVTVSGSTGAPSSAPTYGGASNGYGNIHVNTSTGDIFIYS